MRILAPSSLLTCFDSRLYHLFNASKLYVACPPTKASGSIVISATKSSPSRESRHHRTHWCWWIVGYDFYGVCDLNTITIYPANLKLFLYFTPINTLSRTQIPVTQTPLSALSPHVSRAKTDRNQNLSSSIITWTTFLIERLQELNAAIVCYKWPRTVDTGDWAFCENAKFGWMSSRR